jgi:hypothetical protein
MQELRMRENEDLGRRRRIVKQKEMEREGLEKHKR